MTISIHALVKRATGEDTVIRDCRRYFNPRPREEGDWTLLMLGLTIPHFNPRPREEGDTL